ncbi:MAG: TetR/AcrR family transcriptional regulator [Planctomycetota bacterium]
MDPSRPKERLVRAATDLFYRRGFHGTPIDEIVSRAETTKTTFYNHYESKDDLALECLQRRDLRWRQQFPVLLEQMAGPSPIAKLHAIWKVWAEWFNEPGFNGCIFIHACSEFPDPNHPCHIAAKHNIDSIRGAVQENAAQARVSDPVALGRQFSLLMQGAIVMEVIDRDGSAVRDAEAVARRLLLLALPNGEIHI